MIVINTVNNERFSLNGIEYLKNFLSFVYGDKVGIYNAYDKTDQRVSLDTFVNFTVNGVVYESAALLQSALLEVIYTRDSLGAINTVLLGSVTPTSTPTGTGVAFWVATQAGTYTNFGGVVVAVNSFAVISRNAGGAFSISQTTLDITSKVNVSDVINTLVSTETAKPLSANQGKVLNGKITDLINVVGTEVTITPSATTTGYITNTGTINTSFANYFHKTYPISDLNKLHYASSYLVGSGISIIHFFKANGDYLGYQNPISANTTILNELIIFPLLTASIKINYTGTANVNLKYIGVSKIGDAVSAINLSIADLPAIRTSVAEIELAITNLPEIQNVLTKSEIIEKTLSQTGGFIGNTGAFSAFANYRVDTYPISDTAKKHFYTTYFNGSALSLLHFYGAGDSYLGSQNYITASTQLTNEPIVFPVGTVKIKVNSGLTINQSVIFNTIIDVKSLEGKVAVFEQKIPKQTIEFTKQDLEFYIRTPFDATRDLLMVYKIGFNNTNVSPNATYIGLNTLTTSQIKATTKVHDTYDSIAPVSIQNYWFISGEHGYLIPKVVSTGHNKVTADLGSMWQCADGKQFKLIKISGNDLYFAPKITVNGGGAGKDTSDYFFGYVMTALTHVSGATNTGGITVTSSTIFQWNPITKNINKLYFIDGKEVTANGVYTCSEVVVKDVYECYNPATITQFEPTITADKWFRTTFVYKFTGMTCAVNHSIELFYPLWLSYYGATQPLGLTKSGDKDSFIFIPKVQSKTGNGVTTDWKQPQNCSVANQVWGATSFAVTANDLIDVNKVPDRIVQYQRNPTTGEYLLGFASGLSLLSSNTRDSIRKTKMQDKAFTFTQDTRNKMYFRVITGNGEEGSLLPTGWVANYNYYFSYYNPALSTAKVYWYKENNNYIVYIHCFEILNNCKIILPDFMDGKVAEIVEKTTDASLITDTIVGNEIYVKFTSALANYIVLKF